MWIRTGLDPNDKSTWKNEYLHLSHHRQIRHEDLCPGAWGKILDICGGEEMLAEERERWVGDSFIINFGSDKRKVDDPPDDPKKKGGWHIDNDWFRMFLDSSECALTVIHCFSDMPEGGGGTMVCEDAIQGGYPISDLTSISFPSSPCCRLQEERLMRPRRHRQDLVRSPRRVRPHCGISPYLRPCPGMSHFRPCHSKEGGHHPHSWLPTTYGKLQPSSLSPDHLESTCNSEGTLQP